MTRQRQMAHHTISTSLRWLTITLGTLCAWQAAAQGGPQGSHANWPTRSVRLIVSQAAGGAPDIVARLVSERLSRNWNQQVIVDNRPGSGNVIGAQVAARAPADGYTLFFATAAALVTNPYTFKSLPYDPARDFAPIGMVARAPFLVLAHPSVNAKSISELVALEKSAPGKLTFATDGPRNFSGMAAAWLNKLGGINILQAPYAQMPQGVQDTLAGRTQLVILAVPAAAPHLKSGALRALATTVPVRLPGYDNIPTVAETYSGFDVAGWFVFAAPSGTPPEIIRSINRDLDAVLRQGDIVERLRQVGMYPYPNAADTPEATAAFIRKELEAWGRVIRELNIQPE